MHRRVSPGWASLGVGLCLALAAAPSARAEGPPTLRVRGSVADDLAAHPIGRKRAAGESGAGSGSGTWWLGTLGVVGALGAFAALSLASRRGRVAGESGSLEVVGRVALGPRQSAVLLRAGDRTLIVGVGPQGAPSLLGELPRAEDVPPPSIRVATPAGRAGGSA